MGKGLAVTVAKRLLAGFAALAVLSACGTDRTEPSPVGQAVGGLTRAATTGLQAIRGNAPAPAAAPQVSRAELEKFNLPILRSVIESRGADALLTPTDQKGDVVTWSTTDGTTFSLRDGVLIQTRGLGPDLMSAQVPSAAQLGVDGGTHTRIYFSLGAEDRMTRRTFECTVTVAGTEDIVIVQRSHRVTRVTETCVRSLDRITNDFWLEGGTIRKSRQWASLLIGHIDFERVID